MRYALFSDVHGETERLKLAMADMRRRGTERIVSLGDIGNSACYDLLRIAGAVGVFGNWEVSGWSRLPAAQRDYVLSLPALLVEDGFLAAHAVPYAPAGLSDIQSYTRYMATGGRRWRELFPYMTESEDVLWKALAELCARGQRILFHGHTHRQSGWRMAAGRLRPLAGPCIAVDDLNARYLIGVGSIGRPEDTSGISYAWYDSQTQTVEWVRLPAGAEAQK
jgi:predicted phosphodiesterase